MRLLPALLAFLFGATIATAQNHPTVNQSDMKKMMQVMQKVQACMEELDQAELDALQRSSEQAMQKIDALCAQGKRDQAQDRAYDYAQKMSSDPTVQQLRRCGEMADGAIPMDIIPRTLEKEDYAGRHVCDG